MKAVLQRAGIRRTAYTIREAVNSQKEAKERARELNAKIAAAEVGGSYSHFDAAPHASEISAAIFRPTARYEVVSAEKQKIKAEAQSSSAPDKENAKMRAKNIDKPGNWIKASRDRQFVHWELIKACCLLHGYEVIDDVGIYDPSTDEVWTYPTLNELLTLITGEPPGLSSRTLASSVTPVRSERASRERSYEFRCVEAAGHPMGRPRKV